MEQSPLRVVSRFGIVAAFALLVGLVIPGAVAWHSHVFDRSSMEGLIYKKYPELEIQNKQYLAERAQIERQIQAIDARAGADGGSALSDINLRRTYATQLRKPEPISIQPFYLHWIMYFWPIMYFGLGSVAFILRPKVRHGLGIAKRKIVVLFTAACICVFQIWPIIFRTEYASSTQQGRTVFAYLNPDIDFNSFEVQMMNFAIFSFLLSVIWVQWSALAVERRAKLKSRIDSHAISLEFNMEELSAALLHWQAVFLLISVGFAVYTGLFWNQIIVHGDLRLGMEAINAHVLWLITSAMTAVPLVLTWRAWKLAKLKRVAALVQSDAEAALIAAKLAALQELNPIGAWNFTASGVAVVVSFAAPLVQALIKGASQ